jgi:hypothetical protein
MIRELMKRIVALTAVLWTAPACVSSAGEDELAQSESDAPSCEVGFEVGDCAPDFTLMEAAGEDMSLSEHSGSVVLLASEALW